jgi:hypothetical protein
MDFVKPGAAVLMFVDTAKENINKLTKLDEIIFWPGTNDITRNVSSKGLTQIMKFFMRNPHTNIILIKASHRFNLDDFYV